MFKLAQMNLYQRNTHFTVPGCKGSWDDFSSAVHIYIVSCFYLLLAVAAEILENELLQIWISNLLGTYTVGVDNKGGSQTWFDYGMPPLMTGGNTDVFLQGAAERRMSYCCCVWEVVIPYLSTNLLLGLWTSVFGNTGIYISFASCHVWKICISSVSSNITPIICYRQSSERAHKGRLSSVAEATCLLLCGSWRHLGVPWRLTMLGCP